MTDEEQMTAIPDWPDFKSATDDELLALLAGAAVEQNRRSEERKQNLRAWIAAHVTGLRKAKGLRQEDLAEMVGCSRTTITNIEGSHQGTTLELLVSLADALGTTTAILMSKPAQLDEDRYDGE